MRRAVELAPGVTVFTDEPESDSERQRREETERVRERRRIDADVQLAVLVSSLGGRVTTTEKGVVEGVFALVNGFTMRARRSHNYYLNVDISPCLPAATRGSVGYKVNHAPLSPDLTDRRQRDSGREMMLGAICRAQGYAGGLFGDQFTSYCDDGLSGWHVDVWDALGPLIATVNREIGEAGILAETADREYRRRSTDAHVLDFDKHVTEMEARNGRPGFLAEYMLNDLTGRGVDESDPRMIAIKDRVRKLLERT